MTPLLLIGAGVLGTAVGSFLNVVADRLPKGGSLISPPSHCPHCQRRLGPLDMIPILSWLALRGRCRTCAGSIPARVFLVELATGFLFAAAAARFGLRPFTALVVVYISLLITVAVIDLEHQRIPNSIVFPAIALGALASPLTPSSTIGRLALGGAVGFFVFLAVAVLIPRGMGMGDVKLAAFVGLILGYPEIVLLLLLAFILGGLVAGTLLVSKLRGRSDPIPFGPFLSLAGVVGLLYGDQLIALWLGRF